MLNRCVTVFNNLFAIWVLLGGLAAYFFPDVFLAMKGGMEYFFGLTMFGIGMTLHLRDFKHIFLHFWQVAVGFFCRFDLLKKRALAIEIGMQNAGLGSILAVKYYNARVAIPAVIFVFICIFSASILVPLWSRSSQRRCALMGDG